MRSGVGVLFIVTLLAISGPAPAARAEYVWDAVGPVTRSQHGMTTVVVDPSDPKIVWLGAETSVWVSDDEGATWSLVLEMSGRNRAEEEADEDEDDEGAEDDDGAASDDGFDDGTGEMDATATDDAAAADDTEIEAETAEEVEFEVGARIERLRVIGDYVYACGGRGLWSILRTARGIGTGREIHFGRRQVVLDVAQTQPGSLWIATARGLHAGGLSTSALPVFGPLGNQPVRALHPLPDGGLLAAAPSGLWQLAGARFARLGVQLGGRQIEDFAAAPGATALWALTRRTAHRLELLPNTPEAEATAGGGWMVGATLATPTARRITVARDGAVWVAGPSGVWEAAPGEAFKPRREGLRTTRLYDIAAPAKGKVRVWVVGQTGAARFVTEVERIWSQRSRQLADQVTADMPTAWDTLRAAEQSREADFSHVGRWKAERATSWLLPEVRLVYQTRRERFEELPLIPVLGQYIIDEVSVVPAYDDLRIMATWDLAAIMFGWIANDALVDTQILGRLKQAQRDREQIRERVVPLYKEWVTRQLERAAAEPKTVRQAIRDQLQLELVEADLGVHTDGWFPRTTGAGAPDPSSEQQGGTP